MPVSDYVIDDQSGASFRTEINAIIQALLGAGKNAIINGGFEVWQRGTGSTSCTAGNRTFLADRFYINPTGAAVNQLRSTTVPSNNRSKFSLEIQGAASVTTVLVGQRIESALIAKVKQSVTFSAQIYNGSGAAFTPKLKLGTPTAEDNFTTVNNRLDQSLSSCSDSAWTEVEYTVDISGYTDIDNGLQVEIEIPSGSLVASDTVRIAQVQLREGSGGDEYMSSGPGIEQAHCKRYYHRIDADQAYTMFATGHSNTITNARIVIPLSEMRTVPTFTSSGNFRLIQGASAIAVAGLALPVSGVEANSENPMIEATVASGLSAGYACDLTANNDSSAYLAFDAEL